METILLVDYPLKAVKEGLSAGEYKTQIVRWVLIRNTQKTVMQWL